MRSSYAYIQRITLFADMALLAGEEFEEIYEVDQHLTVFGSPFLSSVSMAAALSADRFEP